MAVNELPRQPFYHVEAARWLAENAPAGSPVMTRYTDPTLYAGLPKVAFPNANWPEVLAYGQAHGARYLVVNSWEIEEVRPYLAPLLTPEDGGLPPGLAFRHRIEGRDRSQGDQDENRGAGGQPRKGAVGRRRRPRVERGLVNRRVLGDGHVGLRLVTGGVCRGKSG